MIHRAECKEFGVCHTEIFQCKHQDLNKSPSICKHKALQTELQGLTRKCPRREENTCKALGFCLQFLNM